MDLNEKLDGWLKRELSGLEADPGFTRAIEDYVRKGLSLQAAILAALEAQGVSDRIREGAVKFRAAGEN